MYTYKENDLTDYQYKRLIEQRGKIEVAVLSSYVNNLDQQWLHEAADIHRGLFNGPLPNIRSGIVQITMFKQLLKKINEYESKVPVSGEAEKAISDPGSDQSSDGGIKTRGHRQRGRR